MAETFFYLTTMGRVSGTPHKIEIWFVAHNDCYYLCSEKRTRADWVQNIMHNSAVNYYLAEGEDIEPEVVHNGTAKPLDDESSDTVKQVKTLFDAKYNWSNGLLVEICQSR